MTALDPKIKKLIEQTPICFGQELEHAQLLAENLVSLPDFGLNKRVYDLPTRTVMEIKAIWNYQNIMYLRNLKNDPTRIS